MTGSTPPPRSFRRRRAMRLLVFAAAVAIAAIILLVVLRVVPSSAPDAAEGTGPGSAAEPSDPAPEPTGGTAASEPPEVPAEVPTECEELYTKDWTPEMSPLTLNPEWITGPDGSPPTGSNDAELASLLDAAGGLGCSWALDGPNDAAHLDTRVVETTAEQAGEAIARMSELGFDCYDQLDGLRCVVELTADAAVDGGVAGESHFLRDGIWFATRWYNIGPVGYTEDMVAAVFG